MTFALPNSPLKYLLPLCLLLALLTAVTIISLPAQGASAGPKTGLAAEAVWTAVLPDLLQLTSSIVYGHVVAAQSRWDENHTMIITDYTIAVAEIILEPETPIELTSVDSGNSRQFSLATEGGFLIDEGLGLWVSHGVTFAVDEDILLLLTDDGEQIQISGGEWGKYTVKDGLVRNEQLGLALPVATFLQRMQRELAQEGRQLTNVDTVQSAFANRSQTVAPASNRPDSFQNPEGDPPRWLTAGLLLDVKINLNSVQIDEVTKTSGDFYMAIRRALRTWSTVENTDFTLLYTGETAVTDAGYNGENEIVFVHKGKNKPIGQAQIWYTGSNVILEVDMWLNDDYQFGVDDDPALNEVDLESVVLHELGHWAPLDHSPNPDAVMYSVLGSMQLKRALHADDIDAVTQLYPCDQPPCIHELYLAELVTPTPRPSPTFTPIPTLIPTAATPTLVPTDVATVAKAIYIPLVMH